MEHSTGSSVKKMIATDGAPQALGPYSQGIMVENMLFCSGQIPIDPHTGEVVNGSVAEQTRQVLDNIGAVLNEAGMDYSDVVSVTVYLADMDTYAELNQVYADYFTEQPPARCAVEVARLPKDAGVELAVIAITPR